MPPRVHRLGVLAFGALAIGAALAVPAAAQDQATSELPSWRMPGWTFTPGVVFGTLYDTNVTLSGPDVSGKTPSDKLFQLSPFGQLEYFSPRTTLSSGYQGALRRYSEADALDGTDHYAYVSLRERLSRRVTLFANDNYSRVPTTDQMEVNGLPFQRTGARYNALIAGVEARLTKTLDLLTRYEMTWVDFVRKQDVLLTGGTVNGVNGNLTRRFTDRVSAGGEYSLRWSDLNQGTKQLAFQETGGVIRYRAGLRTDVSASAGVAHLIDRNRDITRTGPYTRLGMTYRTDRATVGADYRRSYVPSIAFGGTNQSQEARGYIQMPLSRNRLYVQESAAWRRNDPFVVTEPALDSIFLHTVFGYAVQKWLRIEGYHAFTTQDNFLAGGKISRQVAGVQFVVSEPMRIR
jgi:hypothetical protein